ncbi:hypothetical protein [Bdellovibrio sp. HCB337]|uniref:hypothetical protein n=1 Tax=Bdellovibrio sp. HCB337 TaxID=3394358 RepID=UPI0039A4CF44
MKTTILVLVTGFALNVSAESIYRCQFSSDRKDKEPFVMTGHIVASKDDDTTYLTLQPPSSTRLPYEARTLITADGYNPMTIHPRGNTVTTVARGELHGQGNQVRYVDSEGAEFILSCVQK